MQNLASNAKGIYALFIHLPQALTLQVGRLGQVHMPAGCAVYVGSAAGPGGLRARVSRHLRPHKRPHWHIDALTSQHQPVAVVMREGDDVRECTWVQNLVATASASVPAPGFGSSDCRCGCPAHLLVFPSSHQPLLRLVLTNPPQTLLYCERKPFLSIYDESMLLRQIACF